MDAYNFVPVDFVFDFSQSGAGASAGGVYSTGQNNNYYHQINELSSPEPLRLDNETVAEIAGMEIFGPYDENRRIRLMYVKPVIDGKELDYVYINERMAPGPSEGMRDVLRESGMRLGHAAVNFGVPVLVGGDPAEATPKIGPRETLSVRVAFPPTAEYGDATITSPMVVRLWLAMVKGENKLNNVLEYYHGPTGKFANGVLDCGFTLGDLETGMSDTFTKQVGSTGTFHVSDWTRLPGGSDVDRPKSELYITYAINRNSTTTNQWYRFTPSGNNVYYSWQKLAWDMGVNEALRITHVGVQTDPNMLATKLYRSNRANDLIYRTVAGRNPLPLPASLDTTVTPGALSALPRSFLVWNENASIEIRDNGTSIPAVSSTETGVMVAVYGKRYEM